MPRLPILLAVAMSSSANGSESSAPEFPAAWGTPPIASSGATTMQPLPGAYGRGPPALVAWVAKQMKADRENDRRHYPSAWGSPPLQQTRDLQRLPFGYGRGSGTLAAWIREMAEKHSGLTEKDYKHEGAALLTSGSFTMKAAPHHELR